MKHLWAVDEDDRIAISALQHFIFCPRQCALIHLEQTFDENVHTMRGHAVHERVDEPGMEKEGSVLVERALPLYSKLMGLTGKADVVEFDDHGNPYPVEYKHGPRRGRHADEIQLAAQAICLEEMTGRKVPLGAIYHHSSRKRREVEIDEALRTSVLSTIAQIREMLAAAVLPSPVNDSRCKECSLIDACQPEAIARRELQSELIGSLFDLEVLDE